MGENLIEAFSNEQAVAHYAEGPPRIVPGFGDLLRMTRLLLTERAPEGARVLVLGAGGGLDLQELAKGPSGWRFDGVDPSAEMLSVAARTLGPTASRVRFHQGYIADAPCGPFDAAVSLLTLHFVPANERVTTLSQVRQRLGPGAPFVVAHLSAPARDRDAWLSRYAAFAIDSGVEPEKAIAARDMVAAQLDILDPQQDEAHLRAAGFTDVELFYAGFAFRGWIAH